MADVAGIPLITITRALGGGVEQYGSLALVPCFVETKDLDFGTREFRKWLESLRYDIRDLPPLGNLELVVKYRNSQDEDLSELAPIPLIGEIPVTFRPPISRYYRMRFQDTGIRERWNLGAFEVFGGQAGRRE